MLSLPACMYNVHAFYTSKLSYHVMLVWNAMAAYRQEPQLLLYAVHHSCSAAML